MCARSSRNTVHLHIHIEGFNVGSESMQDQGMLTPPMWNHLRSRIADQRSPDKRRNDMLKKWSQQVEYFLSTDPCKIKQPPYQARRRKTKDLLRPAVPNFMYCTGLNVLTN